MQVGIGATLLLVSWSGQACIYAIPGCTNSFLYEAKACCGIYSAVWTCMVSSIQICEGEPGVERVAVARKPASDVSTW